MALPLLRLGIFVLAQNIFVELHVGAKKILKPRFDPLSIFQDFVRDVISVDVDTDAADDSKVFAFNRDARALVFSTPNVEFVV